jgi:hypothetical protein
VFAITLIKNKSVFSYRFSVYHSPQTIGVVLGKLKADVSALLVANGRGPQAQAPARQ